MQLSSPNWGLCSVALIIVFSLQLLIASVAAFEDPSINGTTTVADIEANYTTTTIAPRNATYDELCDWGERCESNLVCRLRFDYIGAPEYRCSCDDVTSWDQWRRQCIFTGITYDLQCSFSWQCASNEQCEYSGGNSRCKCEREYAWDADFKECLPRPCYEYCNYSGYSCRQGVCTYDQPPSYDNEYSSVPVIVIFGMFATSMLVVCCVWKCAMRRRLQQMHAGPASIVVMPSSGQGRSPNAAYSNGPTTPDDPPKYSNLQQPIWMLTQARGAEVQASPVTQTANAERQQASAAVIDSPPPYELIAPPVPPRA